MTARLATTEPAQTRFADIEPARSAPVRTGFARIELKTTEVSDV